jgi:hypothetical protein
VITRAYLSSSVLYSVGRFVVCRPTPRARLRLLGCARIDEHSDHHRNLAPVDQVVHHVLCAYISVLGFEGLTVLKIIRQPERGSYCAARRPSTCVSSGIALLGNVYGPRISPLGTPSCGIESGPNGIGNPGLDLVVACAGSWLFAREPG